MRLFANLEIFSKYRPYRLWKHRISFSLTLECIVYNFLVSLTAWKRTRNGKRRVAKFHEGSWSILATAFFYRSACPFPHPKEYRNAGTSAYGTPTVTSLFVTVSSKMVLCTSERLMPPCNSTCIAITSSKAKERIVMICFPLAIFWQRGCKKI
jgi:hypothetical protein